MPFACSETNELREELVCSDLYQFISTRARIQQLRPVLSDEDVYIKVDRWLIYWIAQASSLDGIIAQHSVSLVRHSHVCKICAHKEREEIEAEFVAWESPATIARNYHLADRSTVYRHAHAFGLFEKRRRNVRAALERIIEQVGEVDVTAQAVVTAVQAYAKINLQGQWIDRTEHVNLNDWFERMTQDELEAYARDGKLPAWFTQTVVATPMDSQEVKNDE